MKEHLFRPRKTGMFMAVAALLLGCIDVAFAQTTVTVGQGGGLDFNTIQEAIDIANKGDTVLVYPGVYYENIRFRGKRIVVRSTDPTDAAVVASTVIDGNKAGPVVRFAGWEKPDCVLSGFTIRNGENSSYTSGGGGIKGKGTFATICNNVITSNTSRYGGGLGRCDGTIRNNVITKNRARVGGAMTWCSGLIRENVIENNEKIGVYAGAILSSCNGVILNNRIRFNSAPGQPGGAIIGPSNGTIVGNVIEQNSGAALECCSGNIKDNVIANNFKSVGVLLCFGFFHNNLIVGNSGQADSAGFTGGHGVLVSNTIADNQGSLPGDLRYSLIALINSIVWGNGPEGAGEQVNFHYLPVASCIQNWTGAGTDTISDDPLFATGPLGSHYLSQTTSGQSAQSPCVDTGSGGAELWNPVGRTTRTDCVEDMGTGDMGYHYRLPSPPEIGVSPVELEMTVPIGADPASQFLEVWNEGDGTLDYVISTSPSWFIRVRPAIGRSNGKVNRHIVEIDSSALGAGARVGEIWIDGRGGGTPAVVRWAVQVLDTRLIVVDQAGGGDYSTIQAAIDAAAEGDTVEVREGLYQENIDFRGKNIVLRSRNPIDSATVAATIIDGGGADSAIVFSRQEGPGCVLSGFTIRNGKADKGGGILGRGTRARIEYNHITSNTACLWRFFPGFGWLPEGFGGGINGCNGVIRYNAIEDNFSNYLGGGIAECDGIIECNRIVSNEATLAGGVGECRGVLRRNEVSHNVATLYGGGIARSGWFIRGNTVLENRAKSGGGFYECEAIIVDNTISGNAAVGLFAKGGGLDACLALIRGNRITGNTAYHPLELESRGGGLSFCRGTIEDNIISNNSALGVDASLGGGLFECAGTIQNNLITENSATTGGALNNCAGLIRGNTIVENSARFGGAMASCRGSIVDCIVWGNTSTSASTQLEACVPPAYSCMQKRKMGGEGNIKADPCFTTGPLGRYYLSQTAAGQDVQSPCVDAGSNTSFPPGFTTRTDGAGDVGPLDMGYHYPSDLPNLVVSGFDFGPAGAEEATGNAVVFTCTVWNAGRHPTTGGFRVELRVRRLEPFRPPIWHPCGSWQVTELLQPGQAIRLQQLPAATDELPPGEYTVGVIVDATDAVSEQREDDNFAWAQGKTLTVGPSATRAKTWRLYR